MKVYVLSSDYQTRKEAEVIVGGFSNCSVRCFVDAGMLQQVMEDQPPDSLLLDAEKRSVAPMVEMLTKGRRMTKVILMADSDAYAEEAFEIGAYGYIVKPLTEEKLKKQLLQIRHPVSSEPESGKDRRNL